MKTFTWTCEDCGETGTMPTEDMFLWDNSATLHQASHASSVFDPMPRLLIGDPS